MLETLSLEGPGAYSREVGGARCIGGTGSTDLWAALHTYWYLAAGRGARAQGRGWEFKVMQINEYVLILYTLTEYSNNCLDYLFCHIILLL